MTHFYMFLPDAAMASLKYQAGRVILGAGWL